MVDILDLCRSERFLAGGALVRDKNYEFPTKRPWARQVTSVHEYLRAIERDPADDARETSWHILEERYLAGLMEIAAKVGTLGCGPTLEDIKQRRSELSNFLAS